MEKKEYCTPNISIPKELLEKLDKEAERYEMTRSGFIRLLFLKYLEGGLIMLSPKRNEDRILSKLKEV